MSDASSIRKTTTPLAAALGIPGPASGALPSETQRGAGFYESAIRFQMNPQGYTYTFVDADGITKSRATGQAFINSGEQWVPVGNKILNIPVGPAAQDAEDVTVFIADRPYNIVSVQGVVSTANGTAGTAAVMVASGTTAIASGTSVSSTRTIDLNATINTVQTLTLDTTIANTQIAAGSRLGLVFTNTPTTAVGLITVVLQPS